MAKIGTYLNLCTPKGRIISGPLYQLNKTEWRNGAQVPVTQDKWRYKFGLALPKSDQATLALLGKIYNHALATYAAYPPVVAAIKLGLQKRSGFSWKIFDGDVAGLNGKTPKNCEGCYVLPFELPELINGQPARFKTVRWNNDPIDWSEVKLGYDCDVAFSVIDNGITVSVPGGSSAGIYLNAAYVRYLGTGEEIVFAPSVDQLMAPAVAPPMKGSEATAATPVVTGQDPFAVAPTAPAQTPQGDVAWPSFPTGASASAAIASPGEIAPSSVEGFDQPA